MLTQTTGKVVVSYEYNVGNKVSKKISSTGVETFTYNGDGTIKTKICLREADWSCPVG